MRKLAIRLASAGLVLGLGAALGAAPAVAQHSGVANTAEDFESADSDDGLFGSDIDIWDLVRRAGSAGAGITDAGFYRSQDRRINREADSLRERQRAILQQQSVESDAETLDFINVTTE